MELGLLQRRTGLGLNFFLFHVEKGNCVSHLEVSQSNMHSLLRSPGLGRREDVGLCPVGVCYLLHHLFKCKIYSRLPDVDSNKSSVSTAKNTAAQPLGKNNDFTVKRLS